MFFVILATNLHFLFGLLAYSNLTMSQNIYLYLKRAFPIWIFAFWLTVTPKLKQILNLTSKVFIPLTIVSLTYLITSYLLVIPFQDATTIKWSYHGALTWNVVFLCVFWGYLKNKIKTFTAFTLSVLTVFAAGVIFEMFHLINYLIYEITNTPQIRRYSLFSPRYPLFIETEWACIALLAYTLYTLRWRPNKKFWLLLTFALAFSLFYTFNMNLYWIARIPTAITFIYLPHANTRKNEEN